MRNYFALLVIFVILKMNCVFAGGANNPEYREGEVIVKLSSSLPLIVSDNKSPNGKCLRNFDFQIKKGTFSSLEVVLAKHKFVGAEVLIDGYSKNRNSLLKHLAEKSVHELESESSLYRLVFDKSIPVEDIIKDLRQITGVASVEPNYIGSLCYAPSDPLYTLQSSDLSLIGIEDAWNYQAGADSSVTVAVIDSGVDINHEDLNIAVNVADSYNFADNNTDIFDDTGHGTRVSGIIAAGGNNSAGIAGIAFGCKLISLDVADSLGETTIANVVSAINYGVIKDVKIINMSLRFTGESQILKTACDNAYEAGVLLVAAGNENQGDYNVYPACYDSVIGVGAVMDDGITRASWSNFNGSLAKPVELVAPGFTIYSTIPGSQYNGSYGSGTSFAAPMISGVVALLMSKNPGQSVSAIREHMNNEAISLGAWAGNGRINAASCLSTPMTPLVEIESVTIDDEKSYDPDNDADGALDKKETVNIIISLKSKSADAFNVTGTLSENSSDVTLSGNTVSSFNNVQNNKTSSNILQPFTSITVSDSSPVQKVTFSLSLSGDNGYNQVVNFDQDIENEFVIGGVQIGYNFTSDKTYHVTSNLRLRGNANIAPGTTIKVDPEIDVIADTGCILNAIGTAEKPILFTSAINASFDGMKKKNIDARNKKLVGLCRGVGPQNNPVNLENYQEVRYVSANIGEDLPSCGTSMSPWRSIQYAIDQITDSSDSKKYAILVGDGVYTGSGDNVVTMKDYIDMYGGYEPHTWTRDIGIYLSIISGENARRCIYGNNVLVDGFLVIYGLGGGIYCSSSTISNCSISNCSLLGSIFTNGGGIYCSSSIIENCNILNNISSCGGCYGGGIYCLSSSIKRCNILRNVADSGGGIYSYSSNIDRCNILRNSGTGIVLDSSSQICNSNVYGNMGRNMFAGGVDSRSSSNIANCNILSNSSMPSSEHLGISGDPNITNCTIRGNTIGTTGLNITYSNIESGYPGTGNIDADPKISLETNYGVITSIDYQPINCISIITYKSDFKSEKYLMNKLLRLSYRYFPIISCSQDTITVVGDATIAESIKPPYLFALWDYHLQKDSPNINVGIWPVSDMNIPSFDLDEDIRSGANCDIGPDEFSLSTSSTIPRWGNLKILSSSISSTLTNTIVERGSGLLNESSILALSNVVLRNNSSYGLYSTNSQDTTITLTAVTAILNLGDGISIGSQFTTQNCVAMWNAGNGISAGILQNCSAYGNTKNGLVGFSADSCFAEFNNGDGLVVSSGVVDSIAKNNRGNGINVGGNVINCQSTNNDGVGIKAVGGILIDSVSSQNKNGGISGGTSVSHCIIEGNSVCGVSGVGSLEDSKIINTSGIAISGASTIQRCVVTNNNNGVTGTNNVGGCYIGYNSGNGIDGGSILNSTIIGNAKNGIGDGINSINQISNSFIFNNGETGINLNGSGNVSNSQIINNSGMGIVSVNGQGKVDNSTIVNNGDTGIRNILSLSHSNIYGNANHECFDNINGSGTPDRNFENNYWGITNTAEMQTKQEWENLSFIQDTIDGSGDWIIDVWPYQTTEFTDSITSGTPAFLLNVIPNLKNAVNVGPVIFTLIFSEPMNTDILPAVTFGINSPYSDHIVTPNPGWISNIEWQGLFWIQSDTGNGVNTIKVSNVESKDGFKIPDDKMHKFNVDTSGGLAANSGNAVAGTGSQMICSWSENGKKTTTMGYNLYRAEYTGKELRKISGDEFIKINANLITGNQYFDNITNPNTQYVYKVFIVDSGEGALEWTAPFIGVSGQFATPTPTPTPSPTPQPINSAMIIDFLNGRINFSSEQKVQADKNQDGMVDIADLVYFLNSR